MSKILCPQPTPKPFKSSVSSPVRGPGDCGVTSWVSHIRFYRPCIHKQIFLSKLQRFCSSKNFFLTTLKKILRQLKNRWGRNFCTFSQNFRKMKISQQQKLQASNKDFFQAAPICIFDFVKYFWGKCICTHQAHVWKLCFFFKILFF